MGQGETAGTRRDRREAGKKGDFPAAARRGGIGEHPPPGTAPPPAGAGKFNLVLPGAALFLSHGASAFLIPVHGFYHCSVFSSSHPQSANAVQKKRCKRNSQNRRIPNVGKDL